jgi:hypothetical protein
MKEDADDLVTRIHREAWERFRQQPPPPPPEPPTIHYTELAAAESDDVLAEEWETYRREVGRLLAEGNEGRHILIKGQRIIGIWNTHQQAMAAAYEQFLGQAFFVHQIQEREPVLRVILPRRWPGFQRN